MIESSSRNGVAEGKSKPNPMARGAVAAGVLALALAAAAPAQAADGCTVLLCLAAPSWRAIDQCVPPVRAVLRDQARGRPFPTCAMAGAGNTASHAWSSAPGYCPPQYTRVRARDPRARERAAA
jgi:hypothetical protein